eukprot:TRINITY_DN915_c0_g1_i2.p1 TRINITY_DN915_c0_g1~~TRINITY_DN915_c0_g1_i2.p1  ORF type:complete len:271 (+),score=81.74 TRINITY_DN915_c0_g1_i2:32-814(+)
MRLLSGAVAASSLLVADRAARTPTPALKQLHSLNSCFTMAEADIEDLPLRLSPAAFAVHGNDFHEFSEAETGFVRSALLQWYDVNRKRLPWRGDPPPWSSAKDTKSNGAGKKRSRGASSGGGGSSDGGSSFTTASKREARWMDSAALDAVGITTGTQKVLRLAAGAWDAPAAALEDVNGKSATAAKPAKRKPAAKGKHEEAVAAVCDDLNGEDSEAKPVKRKRAVIVKNQEAGAAVLDAATENGSKAKPATRKRAARGKV